MIVLTPTSFYAPFHLNIPVPPRPEKLPFQCKQENIDKMKDYLLDRYASSTFNVCLHCPFPCMEGPQLELHVDKDAKPYACYKAAKIPLQWEQEVYTQYNRTCILRRTNYMVP